MEISKICESNKDSDAIPDWEKKIYQFIEYWFSEDNYIEARTSGSTGEPTTVQLRKDNIIESANATIEYFGLRKGETIWLCLPMKYIAARLMIVRAIVGELNLVYSEPSSIPKVPDTDIAFTAMVQNQVGKFIETSIGTAELMKAGKLLIGGSSILQSVENALVSLGINAWHSYGMTETITHIALRKIGSENRFQSLPGVVISTNEKGQLIIDSPIRGVNNLVTNDLCEIDDDGSFVVSGRLDNVIITGGIKVKPELVENTLSKIISNEFFVSGLPHNSLGQQVVLFIEGLSHNITIDDIKSIAEKSLSKYEMPKMIVSVKDFIRTESGKIRRKQTITNYHNRD